MDEKQDHAANVGAILTIDDDLEPIGTDTGLDRLIPDDRENERFVRLNLGRNYLAHFSHGMFGMTGFRLIYAPTFVPAYLFALTGSTVMVGLSQALQQVGAVLSPLLSASEIEDKRRILPNAMRNGTMMRIQLLGLALSGWFLSGFWLVLATMGFLFLLGYYSGAQRVSFQMLMAKVIPIEKRGRLQGYRNLAGGGIAAALSWWAGSILIQKNILGNGYATTFMLSFILTSVGLTMLALFIREPDNHRPRAPMRLRDRIRELPQLLAERSYRNFLIAQLLTTGGRIAMPFCILHAGDVMHLDGTSLGLFSLAFLGAETLSNLVWGALGDRKGFRLVYILANVIWLVGFLLMLAARDHTGFVLGFVALGAAMCGYSLSQQTLVLEFGAREDTPMRLALSTTAETSVAAIGPFIGGIIAAAFGFVPLIWVSMALLAAALLVILLGVQEPRFENNSL
ncbi:MAG: MFS transporter [Sphingomonadales bacterium]|jgi:MFS family permease|nr:MFS transporter [Sphingomonadales bacterium]MBK6721278.1 MFS transporter [Sphingomonadales bacterium]MBK8859691.1 MFS transporter [Sphingomonadales bacterium]MBK9587804.1 MFS transporter [Sphingomonadales bacterium]